MITNFVAIISNGNLIFAAALTLLEYSCRLQSELQNRSVLSRRSRALSVVVSLLSLLPEADQFLTLPASVVTFGDIDSLLLFT